MGQRAVLITHLNSPSYPTLEPYPHTPLNTPICLRRFFAQQQRGLFGDRAHERHHRTGVRRPRSVATPLLWMTIIYTLERKYHSNLHHYHMLCISLPTRRQQQQQKQQHHVLIRGDTGSLQSRIAAGVRLSESSIYIIYAIRIIQEIAVIASPCLLSSALSHLSSSSLTKCDW